MNFLRDLFQKIAEDASKFPDEIKIFSTDAQLTNSEFYREVLKLSSALNKNGAKLGDRAAILLESNHHYYVSIFACLHSGVTYIPLSLSDPEIRVQQILDQAKPKFLLSKKPFNSSLSISLIDVEGVPRAQATVPMNAACQRPDEESAYLIFTSGSTGVPKGVEISLSCIAAFVSWAQSQFSFSKQDCFFGFAKPNFDLSIPQIFLPFLSGAKLFLPNEGERAFPGESLLRSGSTIAVFVPRITNVMESARQLPEIHFPHLQQIWFCGEQVFFRQLSLWKKNNPNLRIYNFYGPTETTFACSYWPISETEDPISIGKPLPHMNFELDKVVRSDSGEEMGELVVIGPQVARKSYLNHVSKNDPFFESHQGERGYRTGDFVRKSKEGNYYWKHRTDSQRKIRGYRVELGEIELRLRDSPHIKDVICLDHPLTQEVVVAVTFDRSFKNSQELEAWKSETIAGLQKHLFAAVIPHKFFLFNEFPVNRNGKIDHTILKEQIVSGLAQLI